MKFSCYWFTFSQYELGLLQMWYVSHVSLSEIRHLKVDICNCKESRVQKEESRLLSLKSVMNRVRKGQNQCKACGFATILLVQFRWGSPPVDPQKEMIKWPTMA